MSNSGDFDCGYDSGLGPSIDTSSSTAASVTSEASTLSGDVISSPASVTSVDSLLSNVTLTEEPAGKGLSSTAEISPYEPNIETPKMGETNSLMHIFLKCVDGKNLTMDVHASDSVDHFQEMVSERVGIPVPQLRLTTATENLQVGRSLRDYKITKGSTVHVLGRLRGGATGINVPQK